VDSTVSAGVGCGGALLSLLFVPKLGQMIGMTVSSELARNASFVLCTLRISLYVYTNHYIFGTLDSLANNENCC